MISQINFTGKSQNLANQRNRIVADFDKKRADQPTVTTNVQEDKNGITNNSENSQKTEKKSLFRRIKCSVANALKTINSGVGIVSGTVRGIGLGAVTTCGIAILGKNYRQHEGKIFGTLGGSIKDAGNGVYVGLKNVGHVLKNGIKELGPILKRTPKSFSNYCKAGLKEGAKQLTAAIAIASGILVLGLEVIKGKIKANQKNANIDHDINEGHNKY